LAPEIVTALEELKESGRDLEAPLLRYWQLFTKQEWIACYGMHCKEYQEAFKVDQFVAQERMKILSLNFNKIKVLEGGCVVLKGMFKGTNGEFTHDRIPLEQLWVTQENQWVIWDNPYEGRTMGFSPPNLKFPKFPCEEDNDLKKGQTKSQD
jgi:hypothetical protein